MPRDVALGASARALRRRRFRSDDQVEDVVCVRAGMHGGRLYAAKHMELVHREVLAEVAAAHAKVPVERQTDGQNRSGACRQ